MPPLLLVFLSPLLYLLLSILPTKQSLLTCVRFMSATYDESCFISHFIASPCKPKDGLILESFLIWLTSPI